MFNFLLILKYNVCSWVRTHSLLSPHSAVYSSGKEEKDWEPYMESSNGNGTHHFCLYYHDHRDINVIRVYPDRNVKKKAIGPQMRHSCYTKSPNQPDYNFNVPEKYSDNRHSGMFWSATMRSSFTWALSNPPKSGGHLYDKIPCFL